MLTIGECGDWPAKTDDVTFRFLPSAKVLYSTYTTTTTTTTYRTHSLPIYVSSFITSRQTFLPLISGTCRVQVHTVKPSHRPTSLFPINPSRLAILCTKPPVNNHTAPCES